MTLHPSPSLRDGAKDPQSLIRLLQTELATTNHEVMLLTLDLERRVAERVTQLSQSNRDLLREHFERRRADEEVRKLNQDLEDRTFELEAANKELEAFSYSVSHDLQAPLRRILGFATLLREDSIPPLSEDSQLHLNKINESATAMSALIDDLLYFSSFSHVELNWESVDMNALLEHAIRDAESEIQDRRVIWNRAILPRAWGDAALLRQVVVNLLSNALKYSRLSDPSEIEIGVKESGSGIDTTVFFVRDNGVGFDTRYADKLFGVFQRLHNASEFEGTGIGLASVRRIITRHGGKTWAEDASNLR